MTLLEVCLSLMIIGIVFAAAIPLSQSVFAPHPLESHLSEFKKLLAHSIASASATRRPAHLRFESKQMIFTQAVDQSASAEDSVTARSGFADDEAAALTEPTILAIPDGAYYVLRMWPNEEWTKPEGRVWHISPHGLLLPLTIKWTMNDSWLAASIDPLTGEIRDVTYSFE